MSKYKIGDNVITCDKRNGLVVDVITNTISNNCISFQGEFQYIVKINGYRGTFYERELTRKEDNMKRYLDDATIQEIIDNPKCEEEILPGISMQDLAVSIQITRQMIDDGDTDDIKNKD